jgi:DUF1009 family protein
MSNVCAVIAGAGTFPLHVAEAAKRQGFRVVAIGLAGWADASLARCADVYEEVSIGELGRLLERLQAHHVQQAVMAGKVTKDVLFDARTRFDAEALSIVQRATSFSVNSLLGAIGERLAKQGIQLLDSSTFLKDDVCPAGVLTARAPTPAERVDIQVGMEAARQLARLDIGQTVVVKRKVVVAVEALEGTDATMRRAGELAGGEGLVMVKMASPAHDMRFDLPVLGMTTLEVAKASGVACLAVEAGKALLLRREALLAHANEAQFCIVGVEG